mmetsp:Transcript_121884/g.344739  ORF Transcript_121884/g.344739 Transcript_121884/m.344739 type:complete len:369 (+) Transcript_121884:44-1150(+)
MDDEDRHATDFESLAKVLGDIEAVVAALTGRMDRDEECLSGMEQEMKRLQDQVRLTTRGGDIVSVAGKVDWRLQRIEAQMGSGLRRLANQELYMETIAMVVESMIGSLSADAETGRCCQANGHSASSNNSSMPSSWTAPAQGADVNVGDLLRRLRGSAASSRSQPALTGGPEASLHRNGQQYSVGSQYHPDGCKPCSFFCFSKRGCKKGHDCEYCHMLHVSRSNRQSLRRRGRSQDARVGAVPSNTGHSAPASSSWQRSAGAMKPCLGALPPRTQPSLEPEMPQMLYEGANTGHDEPPIPFGLGVGSGFSAPASSSLQRSAGAAWPYVGALPPWTQSLMSPTFQPFYEDANTAHDGPPAPFDPGMGFG